MRRSTNNEPATYADVIEAIKNLNRDVVSLERSLARLAARLRANIDRPENEGESITISQAIDVILALSKERGHQDLRQLRDIIVGLKFEFDGVHRDVGMIRAHMDAVANDAALSIQYKTYLDD